MTSYHVIAISLSEYIPNAATRKHLVTRYRHVKCFCGIFLELCRFQFHPFATFLFPSSQSMNLEPLGLRFLVCLVPGNGCSRWKVWNVSSVLYNSVLSQRFSPSSQIHSTLIENEKISFLKVKRNMIFSTRASNNSGKMICMSRYHY